MAHSSLRQQSSLARSLELERSIPSASEMLPGTVSTGFLTRREIYASCRQPRDRCRIRLPI